MTEPGIKCKGCGKPAPTQEPGKWSDLCPWCASQAGKAQAEHEDTAIKAGARTSYPPAVWGSCARCGGDGVARPWPGCFSIGGPWPCGACDGTGEVVGHLDADDKFVAGPPGGKITWKERYAQALRVRTEGTVKTPLYDNGEAKK